MIKKVLSHLITYHQMNHLMPHSEDCLRISQGSPWSTYTPLSAFCLLLTCSLFIRGGKEKLIQLQEAYSCFIKLLSLLQKLLEISCSFFLAASNHYNLTDSVIPCLIWKWLDCCLFAQPSSTFNDSWIYSRRMACAVGALSVWSRFICSLKSF